MDYHVSSKSSRCLFNALTDNWSSKMKSVIDIEKINKAEIKKEINILTIFGSGTSVINCSPKNMANRLTKKLTAPNVWKVLFK